MDQWPQRVFSVTCVFVFALARSPAAADTVVQAGNAPLTCPSGTAPHQATLFKQEVRLEGCKDTAGKRQGPFRYVRQSDGWLQGEGQLLDGQMHGDVRHYAEDGELLYVTQYALGVEGLTRFTPAGLENLARLVNEGLKRDGRALTVFANNEGGLTMEQNTGVDYPGHPATTRGAEMARAAMEPLVCTLLARVPELPLINLRLTGQMAASHRTKNFDAASVRWSGCRSRERL